MKEHQLNQLMLNNFQKCTGCGACAAICKTNAIAMMSSTEGFYIPYIDQHKCTRCGLCLRICPVNPNSNLKNTQSQDIREKPVFASWNLQPEIREQSSSGGVFTALAERVITNNGYVVGAALNNEMIVEHTIITSISDIQRLRGSKYVQSKLSGDLLRLVKASLDAGTHVLFSGTPCQIAGLYSYLRKKYDCLLTVDIVCHGTPSPILWRKYLDYRSVGQSKIVNASFRDKVNGWKSFSMRVDFSESEYKIFPMRKDPYMRIFLSDIALKNACYHCGFANLQRASDLTLADFWGVSATYPEYDQDDKGTSLVIVNSPKGESELLSCKNALFLGNASLETATQGNPRLLKPLGHIPRERKWFYKSLARHSVMYMYYKMFLYKCLSITKIKRRFNKTLARLGVA